ncbi:mechanosensitive ion channel family protein [Adhaeribacter aquaticus]|uniref:mechanosensitive ion channel family protein n=1 Tax=Adhaeribacter aquaticus TaxID=299567 RepID=UPI001FE024E6|nr:mechanosensitive ion channel domain-containing protein [Adhaeribacter aquaticus]
MIPRRNSRIRKKRINASSAIKGAENKLKNFRQASILAVAITGFMMLFFTPGEAGLVQSDSSITETSADTMLLQETNPTEPGATTQDDVTSLSSQEATNEALGALQNLWNSFFYNLPKILIALATLILAWLFSWLIKKILQRVLGNWASSSAIISLISISVWLLAIGVALSVVAGDIRALVGSLGLIGLALSWSLQTPIESFTGWLLNSFQGYYRVGDRIRVGEVFGDVYRIDFLTTTVWEIGSPFQASFVHAEQPTGRMVTFPNNEVLTGTITNLTGDFPFVWDELSVTIANESDLPLAVKVLETVAKELLGDYMIEPARQYAQLLKRARLIDYISDKPQVYVSTEDSWTSITIRYLVGARDRRKWKSDLTLRVAQELAKPEYSGKIISVYPRQQVQVIDSSGLPVALFPKPADDHNKSDLKADA